MSTPDSDGRGHLPPGYRLIPLVGWGNTVEAATIRRRLRDLLAAGRFAERLYGLAARTYQLEGFYATAGDEGLAAMAALNQILPGLLALHDDNQR